MSTSTASASAPPAAAEAGGRLMAVDALRGLAALAVLTFHTVPDGPLPWWGLSLLHQDLDGALMVFFVISGALIAAPFVAAIVDGRRRPSIRNFSIRRCARIFPAFWVALLVMVILTPGTTLVQATEHALLLQNVVPGQVNMLVYPAWTLEIEASFYFTLAVAGWLVFRSNRRVNVDAAGAIVLGLWAVSLLITVWADGSLVPMSHRAEIVKYTFPAQFAYLAPGLLLALLGTEAARSRGRWWAWFGRVLDRPAYLVAAIAFFVLMGMWMTWGTLPLTIRDIHREPFAVAAGLMVGGALRHERSLRRVSRLVLPLGLITYSLYLWHAVVIHALHSAHVLPVGLGAWSWPVTWLLIVVASCAVAAPSYLFIERPALRWSIARSQLRALGSEKVSALVPHLGSAKPGREVAAEPLGQSLVGRAEMLDQAGAQRRVERRVADAPAVE